MNKDTDILLTAEAVRHTYRERNKVIIVGLTGRTGSGCTTLSKILATKKFADLNYHKYNSHNYKSIEERKKYIIQSFMNQEDRWIPFDVIDVSSLILNFVFLEGKDKLKDFLGNLSTEKKKNTREKFIINGSKNIAEELDSFDDIYSDVYKYSLGKDIKNENIDSLFEYYSRKIVSNKRRFQRFLEDYTCYSDQYTICGGHKHKPYDLYTYLMQVFGNNIRSSGNPFDDSFNPESYTKIAKHIKYVIDLILKKKKDNPVRICIDALRNPYEAFYLRDKYKAFYLISVNTEEKNRQAHLGNFKILERNNLDDMENSADNSRTESVFFHQNIQACTEIADIHLYNTEEKDTRYHITEQVVRYIALMLHPGLITPTAEERCMQLAYNAKLNSGCLSRQVGAVVTRDDYTVQGIGWNDVPKGQVSCLYRDVHDFCENRDPEMHSKHELENEKFIHAMNYIDEVVSASKILHNCKMCVPYCFKDVHEGITGQKNQVHTRALHAEENAFLQVAKYGGTQIKGGYLFTTASPCELCSKKAYQLGIKEIFYIDPYPGISQDHILTFGSNMYPKMTLFQGSIGEAYVSLYRPRIATKDEIELLTGVKIKEAAKCKPEADGVTYNDVEYLKSYLKLEFKGNRTDVEIHRSSEVKILNEKIRYFIKNFEWTESTFDSIRKDEAASDPDIDFEELAGDHPKSYKIKFDARKDNEKIVKYGVIIKAKDEKKMMEQEVAYYSFFKTKELELKLTAPDGIIKEAYKFIYADIEKKMLVSKEAFQDNEIAIIKDRIKEYTFKVENVNVHYYYAIEWEFE